MSRGQVRTTVWIAAAILGASTRAISAEPSNALAPASAGSQRLAKVVEMVWMHRLEEEPELRMREGLAVRELPRVGPREVERSAEFGKQVLEALSDVAEADISYDERLTLELLRYDAKGDVEAAEFAWLFVPVTPYASPLAGWLKIFPAQKLTTPDELAAYLDLVAQAPVVLDQTCSTLRRQAARGIVLPKAEIELAKGFVANLLPAGGQGTFQVKPERLSGVAQDVAAKFQADLASELDEQVRPALDRLTGYLGGAYLAQAPEAVGQWQYPHGEEYYRWLVRRHTTMEVTPEEVHRIGLERVQRIDSEMEKIRRSLGFTGTRREFHQKLKSEPRLFAKTPEEVREKLLGYQRRLAEHVGTLFSLQPKAPWDVQRLDPSLEASMTFGYYQPPTAAEPKGTYFFNGSKLSERSLLQAEALIYHELVPGHHFQIALQYENEKLPELRQVYFTTAYTEGWGEYASSLGEELGGYQDPYDRYGRLGMEMFLTMRLVVDTGMNYLKWPREKAIEMMKDYMLESDAQIGTETLRYSCDIPGQALAYMMGATKIRALREKAAHALGDKFDVRRFHEAVLSSGNLPMAVLEKHIDHFIEQERTRSGS